jgi:flagellar M-ring protein FliF
VLGYGNSMVQVNADLNFDQVEKTMENYDPDSQVAVSEQQVKASNSGRVRSDSTAQSNDNTITNYEISKTIEKVISGSGNIKRLSVAAVINDIPKEVKKGTKTDIVFDPRPQEQIKKLEEIIKNAVGLDLQRNDQFSITNIPFETKQVETITEEAGSGALPNPDQWINLTFIVVAIVSSIFVLKNLMKRLKNERIVIGTVSPNQFAAAGGVLSAQSLPQPQSQVNQLMAKKKNRVLPMGDIEDDISDEAMMKKNQQERIVNYVTKNPMDAAKLINAWMHEDEI